jgi:hypothetical protein
MIADDTLVSEIMWDGVQKIRIGRSPYGLEMQRNCVKTRVRAGEPEIRTSRLERSRAVNSTVHRSAVALTVVRAATLVDGPSASGNRVSRWTVGSFPQVA